MSAKKLDPRRDSTDPPDPPESEPPSKQKPHMFDTAAKRWLLAVGCVASVLSLLDMGIRIGSGTTATQLSEIKDEVRRMREAQESQQVRVTEVVTELRVQDVVAQLKQLQKNQEESREKETEDRKNINMMLRSIEGYNAIQAARGKMTPLPLQRP